MNAPKRQADLAPTGTGDDRVAVRRLTLVATLLALCFALADGGLDHLEWQRTGAVTIVGDLDPYVRLVQAGELVETRAWLDHSISDAHLGVAEELAWSRPLDVLILGLYLPLSEVLPERAALLLAGSLSSPILWVVCIAICCALLRAAGVGPFGLLCGVLAFACHPILGFDFEFGRADHHALVQLSSLVFLGLCFHVLRSSQAKVAPFAAGAAAGFGIWVHPEAILLPALLCGFLAVRWCAGDLRAASKLSGIGAGAVLLLVLAVLLEQGPAAFGAVEHDGVSIVHVSIFTAVTLSGLTFRGLQSWLPSRVSRLLVAGGLGGAALGTLAIVYPGFQQGPLAAMDPALEEIWFTQLAQSQPLLQLDVHAALEYLAVALFMSTASLGALAWQRTRALPEARPALEFLIVAILLTTGLAFGFRRLIGVLALLSVPAMGILGDALWKELARRDFAEALRLRIGRIVAIEAILAVTALGPQVVLWASEAAAEPTRERVASPQTDCRSELLRWIQHDRITELGGRSRALVVTRPGDGPALLFWTDHRIVAWNHHRSTQGLALLDRLFHARDEVELRAAASEAEAELALYCPSQGDAEPYWRRDDPKPLPTWITALAGDRRGDTPVLLALAPDDPQLANHANLAND